MAIPPRNLAPEQQAWGRYIEQRLKELEVATGIVQTNVNSAAKQAGSATGIASVAHQETVGVQHAVEAVEQVAESKTNSAASSKQPANPAHNDIWYNPLDGNKPHIYIDLGPERRNYALNSTFASGVDGWTVTGGVAAWVDSTMLGTTAEGDTVTFVETDERVLESEPGGSLAGVLWSAQATVVATQHDAVALVRVVDSAGVAVSYSTEVAIAPNVPTVITSRAVIDTTNPVHVEVHVTDLNTGDVVAIDRVDLEPVAEIVWPYFDGSTPGCAWEGPVSRSTSYWPGTSGWYALGDYGSQFFMLSDPTTAETTLALDNTGGLSVRQASVTGIDNDGDGVADSGFRIYGREFLEYIRESAGGVEASAFLGNAANGIFASGITTPFGLGEISFLAQPGQNYLIIFDGLHFSSTAAGDRPLLSIRGTTDGTVPRVDNGNVYASKFGYFPVANKAISMPALITMGVFAPDVAREVRLIPVVERFEGTGSITAYTYNSGDRMQAPFRLFMANMGVDVPDTYLPNDGGGVRLLPDSTPAPPVPIAPSKRSHTSTWAAQWGQAYESSNNKGGSVLGSSLVQGFTPSYPSAGRYRSLAGIGGGATSGEVGKTIEEAIGPGSGAIIDDMWIYLYCTHTHSYSGGVARIGFHGNTTKPETAPAAAFEAYGSASFKRGEGRWMRLTAAQRAEFASGGYDGITVGPGGDYMKFAGSGPQRPALMAKYRR